MFDLYLIADGAPAATLEATIERALRAAPPGRVAVQLRCKAMAGDARQALGSRLRAVTAARDVALVVNGDLALACAIGADGVHLPHAAATSQRVRAAQRALPMVGVSCHDARALAHARRAGASFATLSPVFAVPGKREPLGIDGFARHAAGAGLPVLALGGVSAAAVAPLRSAGAAGVAVIRAVLDAPEPERAVRELLRALA